MLHPWFALACLTTLALWAHVPAASGASTPSPLAGVRFQPAPPTDSRPAGFALLTPAQTGVSFTNHLRGDLLLTNAVAHNGSGLAIGDVDGDGRPDVYLCALEGANRLYRNLGGFRFAEMDAGPAACSSQLSTGAAFADVDGDGDLDLLVNGIAAGTRLFLNQGNGTWNEARDSGLSRTASATSLSLADIDGDGDLDLYCTHYIDMMYLSDPTTRLTLGKQDGSPVVLKVNDEAATSPRWKDRFAVSADGTVTELPETDGFYRNDGGGRFQSIIREPGLFQDELGRPIPPPRHWGLAVMFRDVNGDHAPDFFVCNDNASPNQFWINTGKGRFRSIPGPALRHASRSSMGVDFADIDRDGHDDFLVLDMLAREHGKRMTQLARTIPDRRSQEDGAQRPLYNRNTLYLGREDGTFAETAFFAGVAATDWSWCPAFIDVDLDGYEDLLITNGFEQDVMDQDSTESVKRRSWTPEQMRRYRQIHPSWHTENAAFRNRRDGTFEPMGDRWGFHQSGVSQGMALADLDGDGDLDVVVNQLNGPACLYRNESAAPRIAIRLRGRPPNTEAVGARIRLLGGAVTQSQEIIAGGRYLSDDETLRVFAAPDLRTNSLRLEIVWRDGSISTVPDIRDSGTYTISEAESARSTPPPARPQSPQYFTDVTARLGHAHAESAFDDWARQPLVSRDLSRLGPGIAWCDFNRDGWEDLIVTAARGSELGVLVNQGGETFRRIRGTEIIAVDQGAAVGWTDGEGNEKIFVAHSNFELVENAPSQLRVYSSGSPPRVLPAGDAIVGPLAVADADGDGDLDLFAGGRALPGKYPLPAPSEIWLCEGRELLPNPRLSLPFQSVGLVTGATWTDLDGDAIPDLALATEWGPLKVILNPGTRPVEVTAAWGFAEHTGLWTSIASGDFNGDGRLDLVAGNWGRNTSYELFASRRLAIFHGDWHGDGSVQILEAWLQGSQWYPIQNRQRLELALPDLAQRFPTHESYSRANVPEILGSRFPSTTRFEIAELESAVFLNRGSRFERIPLPPAAQLSPATSIQVGDFDGDGIEDLFLCQNYFGGTSDIHRDDGGQGLWLRGKGDGHFEALPSAISGIRVDGEQRGAGLADFNHDGRLDLAVALNNGPTRLFLNQRSKPGMRITLNGTASNPHAIGAHLRLVDEQDHFGPVRRIQAGSGSGTQDAPTQVLGWTKPPKALWIRWPGGREQTFLVSKQTGDLEVNETP